MRACVCAYVSVRRGVLCVHACACTHAHVCSVPAGCCQSARIMGTMPSTACLLLKYALRSPRSILRRCIRRGQPSSSSTRSINSGSVWVSAPHDIVCACICVLEHVHECECMSKRSASRRLPFCSTADSAYSALIIVAPPWRSSCHAANAAAFRKKTVCVHHCALCALCALCARVRARVSVCACIGAS